MPEATSEKWTYFDTSKGFAIAVKEYPPRRIANVPYGEQKDGKHEGYAAAQTNAQLMAAAPELLTLAEKIEAHFADTDSPLGHEARCLLARLRA